MGKSTINGPFPVAMLNNQRVSLFAFKARRFHRKLQEISAISETVLVSNWIRYGRGLSLSVQLDPATTLRQQLRKVRLLRCGVSGWLKTTGKIGVVHITPGCKINNIYRCIIYINIYIYEYSTSQLMSLFVRSFVRSFVCLFVCLFVCPLQHWVWFSFGLPCKLVGYISNTATHVMG